MTDIDDAILDSIDNDKVIQSKTTEKTSTLRDIEKRIGIDLDMEKFSKASFSNQQMEGFDPKIKSRTGEDDLLDAIAKHLHPGEHYS